MLAQKLNRPVIPVFIQGAYEVMPPKKWLMDPRAATIVVTIGEPMALKEGESVADFSERVRSWFLSHS